MSGRVGETEIAQIKVVAGHATEHLLPDLQPAGARARRVRTQHNIERASVPQPQKRHQPPYLLRLGTRRHRALLPNLCIGPTEEGPQGESQACRIHGHSPCRARVQMPESSTFRNHDPPRGQHACGHGRRAGGRGGQQDLRNSPGVRDVPPGPSASVPASGRRWSSRHARGHTDGGLETGRCTACIDGRGFPEDLDEVEELDTITIRPHPVPSRLCGAHALPMKARSC